jgi:aminoglycoside phosphotransferase
MRGTDELVPVPIPRGVPEELGIAGPKAQWLWEQIGDSGDEVHRIVEPGRPDRFLKTSIRPAEGRMANERDRMAWLKGKLPIPEVLGYAVAGGKEWLVTAAVPGHSACHPYLSMPRDAVVREMARWLRRIHSLPKAGCPFVRRLDEKIADAAASAKRRSGEERERLARFLALPRPAEDLVVVHGDYCEPNIIFAGAEVAGFIDLGFAGVSDRYSDFCQAAYSLNRNGDGALTGFFFAEYGPPALDEAKLEYYMELEGWLG